MGAQGEGGGGAAQWSFGGGLEVDCPSTLCLVQPKALMAPIAGQVCNKSLSGLQYADLTPDKPHYCMSNYAVDLILRRTVSCAVVVDAKYERKYGRTPYKFYWSSMSLE